MGKRATIENVERQLQMAKDREAAKNGWLPMKTAPTEDYSEVALWIVIHPSAMSFGWGDAFCCCKASLRDGKWGEYIKDGWSEFSDSCELRYWRPLPLVLAPDGSAADLKHSLS